MPHIIALMIFLLCNTLHAKVEDHLRKISNKTEGHSFGNIDFIYMINLDERPEKYQGTLEQLAPYGIIPFRFSAVNGWKLSLEEISTLGTAYDPKMGTGKWGTSYPLDGNGEPEHEIMHVPGKRYFGHCLSRGAIGILLSHLSILKDAYDSGYETIWVLEDDIEVLEDPRILPQLIKDLDKAVKKEGWDILFTDIDTKGRNGKHVACLGHAWRPNLPSIDLGRFAKRQDVGANFKKIGARYGAYSMIVRRSGMKKILDFFKDRSLFLPFDMEFPFPAQIKLFNLKRDVVSTLPLALSDNGGPFYQNKN